MRRTPQSRQCSDLAFFVTSTLKNRIPLFEADAAAKIVLDSLQFFRSKHEIELYGYVIMPNHVHIVLKPLAPVTLPDLMRRFKSFVAHPMARGPIWEKGYWSQALPTEQILTQKLLYMHDNPLRKGFVSVPSHYSWSSAKEYSGDQSFALIDRYWGPASVESNGWAGRARP